MTTKKIKIAFTLLLLFTFYNCCKKEDNKAQTTIERLSPTEYSQRMDSITVQLIDIRSPEEFNQGHIKNADNINVLDSSFTMKITKYKKEIPVYVYCTAGGKRSIDAAKILQKEGYNVVNLEGGLVKWTESGNKIIK